MRTLVALVVVQIAMLGAVPNARTRDVSTEFVYHQRVIFVRARVDDTDGLLFLVDTGASASAVDRETAERLKLPIAGTQTVEGTAGVIEARTTRLSSLSIGTARVPGLLVSVYDLGGILAPPGARVDGILGYDFLRSFSVRIDFARRIMTLSTREKRGRVGAAIPVAFTLDNGIPRLRGTLDGVVAADFRLDTGASIFETPDVYLNVTEGVWARLVARKPGLAPEQYFTGSGAGGEVRLPVARVGDFTIGGVTVRSPFVIVQPRLGYFARADAVGFVSNNLLEKFSPVTISYPERTLYLTPK